MNINQKYFHTNDLLSSNPYQGIHDSRRPPSQNTQNTQNTQQLKRMVGKTTDFDVDEILFKDEILSELFEKISCVCNEFQNEVLLTDRPMLIENLNRCMWGVLQPHITMEAYDDYVECEDYDDNESFVSSND